MEDKSYIKGIINNLPEKPGIYKFLDQNKSIIYIGKAKSLKKRVSSYFQKQHYENAKLKLLIKRIHFIEHIVVETESDALLLENNLIKEHQPKYNINLKDDKTFPWICIKNESFPRVFSTRNYIKDGSRYFGPYTSAHTVRTLLELIRELYPLRTCSYNLSEENIVKEKYKLCLEYHLGNCLGPCRGLQNSDDYENSINGIQNILKGNLTDVIVHLKSLMNTYAENFKFEEAENVKQKIIKLEKFQLKSAVVSSSINNLDVFGYAERGDDIYVNYLLVNNGSIIQTHNIELKKKLNEPREDVLLFAITDLRQRLSSNSREIIIPFTIEIEESGVRYFTPQKGDKKKLLDLSMRNARYFMLEKKKQKQQFTSKTENSINRKLETLQKDLRMKTTPKHIECFDNSNISGTNPVAACVVFKNLQPSKPDYRHFNIKSVSGPDDFASMKEVVFRRYRKQISENNPIPDLIIIDGGKGQLNAAVESLRKLKLRGKIAIIGIAKRLEELYFPDDPVPLYLDKNSESLKIIQSIRNEAHRFGIKFHRNKRSGSMLTSELEKISGIGPKTIQSIISEFGSLENLKNATKSEMERKIGKNKAELLWKALIYKNK